MIDNNSRKSTQHQKLTPLLPRTSRAAESITERADHVERTLLLLLIVVENHNNKNKIQRRVGDSPPPSTPQPRHGQIYHCPAEGVGGEQTKSVVSCKNGKNECKQQSHCFAVCHSLGRGLGCAARVWPPGCYDPREDNKIHNKEDLPGALL